MKTNRLFLLYLSMLLLVACAKDEVQPADVIDHAASVASCKIPGVIAENECGLIIELENGIQLYAESYPKGFTPEVGVAVDMAYRKVVVTNSQSQSNRDDCCGGCGGGNCGGDDDHKNSEMSCMQEAGVTQVTIQCITPGSDS